MPDFNPASGVALADQLADFLRRRIAAGYHRTGDSLPSAHALAEQTGVHANTVLKAYRILAREGLIDLRRSRGASVRAHPDLTELDRLIALMLDEAARQGLSLAAVLSHVTAEAAAR